MYLWLSIGVLMFIIIAWTEINSKKLWREHEKASGICDKCSMRRHCRLEERHRKFLNYMKELREIRLGES